MNKENYTIFLDTNAFYTPKPTEIACSDFYKLERDFKDVFNLTLKVPRIALQERAYQLKKLSISAHDKVTENYKKILQTYSSTISPSAELPSFDFDNLTKQEIQNWVQKNNIEVIETPFNHLSLEEIAILSVNRVGVFEETRSGQKVGEKGFRDYLIYKTIEPLINNSSKTCIVTGDKLLREEFIKQENLNLFKDLNELHNFLSAKRDHIENEILIKTINLLSSEISNPEKWGKMFSVISINHSYEFQKFNPCHIDPLPPDYQWKYLKYDINYDGINYIRKDGEIYQFEVKLAFKYQFQISTVDQIVGHPLTPQAVPPSYNSAFSMYQNQSQFQRLGEIKDLTIGIKLTVKIRTNGQLISEGPNIINTEIYRDDSISFNNNNTNSTT